MAQNIDIGFVIFGQGRCHLVERTPEGWIEIGAAHGKGNFGRHVEHQLIAFARYANARASSLLTQLLFLLIHIITNAGTRDCANACSDDFFGAVSPPADQVSEQIAAKCACPA